MRLVCYEDQNTSLEQVIKNIPGEIFEYQLWDFTTERSFAIKYALAQFKVSPKGDNQSLLEWTFSFKPTSYFFRMPLKFYLKNNFKQHMEQGLQNIKKMLEA